jgi:prepilin-type N-terminal cleavage/methylation domain-containing protein
MRLRRTQGFTLLELSIVLCIIAVIAGGIVSGQDLIQNARLQSVAIDEDKYTKAIQLFKEKYHALPGDMPNAESFWGSDYTCPNTPFQYPYASPHVATCNGDGNGHIGDSDINGNLTNPLEWWRAWQQLVDAGFIQASVSGIIGYIGLAQYAEVSWAENVPASQVINAGWTLNCFMLTTNGSNTSLWADQYGHLLNFGALNYPTYTTGAAITPADALSIDAKIDDGMPGTGKVRAWRTSVLPDCTNETGPHNTQFTAIYNTTFPRAACALVFLLGY